MTTPHGLDTDTCIFFYEPEFYPLSNFSAFRLQWVGRVFDTAEAAYHWEKFPDYLALQDKIMIAPSAHAAFKLAEANKEKRRADWDTVKPKIMLRILLAKAEQHEYVQRKLLETGDRILIENSWRDDYWGWGADRERQKHDGCAMDGNTCGTSS